MLLHWKGSLVDILKLIVSLLLDDFIYEKFYVIDNYNIVSDAFDAFFSNGVSHIF